MKTRSELEENQMKLYQWEKDQMQHMKVSPMKNIMGIKKAQFKDIFNIAWYN